MTTYALQCRTDSIALRISINFLNKFHQERESSFLEKKKSRYNFFILCGDLNACKESPNPLGCGCQIQVRSQTLVILRQNSFLKRIKSVCLYSGTPPGVCNYVYLHRATRNLPSLFLLTTTAKSLQRMKMHTGGISSIKENLWGLRPSGWGWARRGGVRAHQGTVQKFGVLGLGQPRRCVYSGCQKPTQVGAR